MLDKKVREYLLPLKVLKSEGCENEDCLLRYNTDQSYFGGDLGCVIRSGGWILLDYGKEYSGGAKIVCNECSGRKNAVLRLTFGESAMEAVSGIGEKNATNDHSVRDTALDVPWIGSVEYGNTGFRFLRIRNESDFTVSVRQVFALFIHSDVRFTGIFRCNDDRLNKIWDAAAYTVFLNMQDYVYDGIKRDRVVWIGDMHPETSAVLRLAGKDVRVERSLELVRKNTPPNEWMNAIPSYSLWWLKIVRDYWFYTGDYRFLYRQKDYVQSLIKNILLCINEDGSYNIGDLFIDWPSSEEKNAQKAGVYALLYIAVQSAEEILENVEGDAQIIAECENALLKLQKQPCSDTDNKQAAALLCFAGLADAKNMNKRVFSCDPLKKISAFLGYYVLNARGMAGDIKGAVELIRGYWGAMLDLGSSTFWEDFDIEWIKGAKPIDSILKEGEYDVHGDNGGYCYKGYRHSLCHGWASGPVPFISEYVLGIQPVEPGFGKVRICPELGDLEWIEGCCPTPFGNIEIRCERIDGIPTITKLSVPKEILVEKTTLKLCC